MNTIVKVLPSGNMLYSFRNGTKTVEFKSFSVAYNWFRPDTLRDAILETPWNDYVTVADALEFFLNNMIEDNKACAGNGEKSRHDEIVNVKLTLDGEEI